MPKKPDTEEKKNPAENESFGVIRVEASLEELPIFSATKRSRREEIVEWDRIGRDPKTGSPIEQKMIIRPARGLGLPGKVERDLYYLVLCPWIERHGFGSRGEIGPISYMHVLNRLGWQRTGNNYKKVREALKTLGYYGHLFDDAMTQTTTDLDTGRLKKGEFRIIAAEWYVKNHQFAYIKPLNLGVYKALNSPLAQSLYTYLDKRAYSARRKTYEKRIEQDIFELRERFRLGVRQTKNLLLEFRRAHEQLMKSWPELRDARIEKITKGRYRCVYEFDVQIDLPFVPEQTPQKPKKEAEKSKLNPLANELVNRGLSPKTAVKLVARHQDDLVRRQLDIHDYELQQGVAMTSPAGRLRKRIEEDWAAPKSYQTPKERQKATQVASEQARDVAQEEHQRTHWWEHGINAEQKAEQYVAGPWLAKWLLNHGFKGEPSREERKDAYTEALERYQAQEEQGKAAQTN
jgi:hypothetical protein